MVKPEYLKLLKINTKKKKSRIAYPYEEFIYFLIESPHFNALLQYFHQLGNYCSFIGKPFVPIKTIILMYVDDCQLIIEQLLGGN